MQANIDLKGDEALKYSDCTKRGKLIDWGNVAR